MLSSFCFSASVPVIETMEALTAVLNLYHIEVNIMVKPNLEIFLPAVHILFSSVYKIKYLCMHECTPTHMHVGTRKCVSMNFSCSSGLLFMKTITWI